MCSNKRLGSWAARWQARYAGYVPKGSLFSFFQKLNMKFRKHLLVGAV